MNVSKTGPIVDRSDSSIPAAEPGLSPSERTATLAQRRVAIGLSAALVLATFVAIPFAHIQLGKVPVFLPSYQTAVIGIYLITAYLLYGNYRATSSSALLRLSAGCVYTAIVLVAQFLSFPDAFVADRGLIGGTQTTIWLWFFWHAGPAVGALLFAWNEYARPGQRVESHPRAVLKVGLATVAAGVATVTLVTTFHAFLPVLDANGNFGAITTSGVAPMLEILLAAALVVLWRASGFKNVVHLWLGLTLVALFCDNAVTMAGATRASLGWYLGRLSALVSSSAMMLVYLRDITQSYRQTIATASNLASSNAQLAVQVVEAKLDPLTKLMRRDSFTESAQQLLSTAVERDQGFATLFIDLDGFKAINDMFGHDHGDIVLVRVADAIRTVLRETELAGRIGGDEFVVCIVAPRQHMLEVATKVAGRIVEKISSLGGGLGASVGISTCRLDVSLAIQEADSAMYDAKKRGKNGFSQFRSRPSLVLPIAEHSDLQAIA